MGPASFIIALLGCAALVANTDFDFPTIVAECRAAKAPAATRVEPSTAAARDMRRS